MTITDLKKLLPISKVLEEYGFKPDRNNMMPCPFHYDKTPSMQIFPKSHTFCCFSTNCSVKTGDQIKLIELMEVKLGRISGTGKQIVHHAILKAKELYGWREETLDDVFFKLQSGLGRSKKAKDYLKRRHLEGIEAGYNSGTYPQLKHCIVFPLKDETGRVVGLYGRSIYDDNKQRHYYQKGQIRGIYPAYPEPGTKKIILAESVIDAATLIKHGNLQQDTSVIAMYGTQGLKSQHERLLKNLPELEEITFYLDGDEAGKRAADKYFYQLKTLLHT